MIKRQVFSLYFQLQLSDQQLHFGCSGKNTEHRTCSDKHRASAVGSQRHSSVTDQVYFWARMRSSSHPLPHWRIRAATHWLISHVFFVLPANVGLQKAKSTCISDPCTRRVWDWVGNAVMHTRAARTDVVFADAGRHEHQHEAGLLLEYLPLNTEGRI